MKRFLMTLYAVLYIGIAVSFAVVEYTSLKVGWAWISTLVMPMGYLFLVVNVPLALIGVIKIGHVVFLHSVQHHRNVMRQIRQADMQTPYPAMVTEEKTFLPNRPDKRRVQLSSPDMSSGLDTMSSSLSSGVQLDEDEIDAPIYTPMEQSILDNERKKERNEAHKTDEQMGTRWGVSAKTIQRTRNAMRQAGKL